MKKILIAFLLFATNAYADSEATIVQQLMGRGPFNGLVSNYLADQITGGAAPSQSIIPASDNALDLGSTALTWRSLYTGTSIISKTSQILQVRQDPQRLFTLDASSDTAFTLKWGDGGTTATQILSIVSGNADADDDATLKLSGGGSSSVTQGAIAELYGNETASVGALILKAGNNASGDVILGTTGTNGKIRLETGAAVPAITITAAGDAAFQASGQTIALQEATAGASCSGTLTLNGATPVVTSTTCATTGSRIFLTRTSIDADTTGDMAVTAISNGVSFSVTSEVNDTATVNWFIIHESA